MAVNYAATFQAAQIGFSINLNLGASAPNLSDAVVNLIVQTPSGTVNNYSASVNGHIVSCLTNGTDFINPGKYVLQVKSVADGETYYGPEILVNVLANLQ